MSGERASGERSRAADTVRRRRFGFRPLLAVPLAVLLLWLAGCFAVVAEPRVDRPARSDAILVLGPPLVDGRLAAALRLAAAHYAGTVVISIGWAPARQELAACHTPNPGYRVICFEPNPTTTRGEAEEIGRLARAQHWHSVLVVTSAYHVSRARLIVRRCMPGTVRVLATPTRPSLAGWAYQFLYQTGGFAKAVLHRSC